MTIVEKGTAPITGQRGMGSWNRSENTTERDYSGLKPALGVNKSELSNGLEKIDERLDITGSPRPCGYSVQVELQEI